MSLTLKQIASPRQRIDLRGVIPADISQIDPEALLNQALMLGKRATKVGDLFVITGTPGKRLTVVPLDDRLDYLGQGLNNGEILVQGSVGHHAGSSMVGGDLTIEGHTGDYAGSAMRGGRLLIKGNTGDRLGAPPAGERLGQRGGLIQVWGNAGERTGECMRRGLLIIRGNTGDTLGYRMVAGSIIVGGQTGDRVGMDMRRGTLLLRQIPQNLGNTFRYNGRQNLGFLTLLRKQLDIVSEHALDLPDGNTVERYLGDVACGGQGEILVLS